MSECKRGLVGPRKPICFMVGDSSGMAVAKVNLPATKLSGFFFSTWEVCLPCLESGDDDEVY